MDDLSTFVRSAEGAVEVGRIFNTPVLVKGRTWLPFAELLVWGIMSFVAGRKQPERPWPQRLGLGALTMASILGSEWCHNLAHAAVASWIGKPAQAIRVTFGMPILVYPMPEDPTVTPRQHIARSLAGPVFNSLVLLAASVARLFTRQGGAARHVADAAVGMNLFLSTVSLTPNPEIDGGPTLKWTLVECGKTPSEADASVKKANRAVGLGLAGAAGLALARRRFFLGILIGLISLISLDFGFRKVKESSKPSLYLPRQLW